MNGIMKAVLAASLVLNVAFAWMLLAPGEAPRAAAAAGGPMAALRRAAQELPPPDRAVLRDALMSRAAALRSAQSDFRHHTTQVLDLLAAEQLDAARFAAEIEAARASRRAVTDEMVGAFLAAAPKLSVESRRKLAERGNAAAQTPSD
jgi:uncharacterized membrane protein